jgi:glucuronoarabinoxylan endo-1,4-beta-xylanase
LFNNQTLTQAFALSIQNEPAFDEPYESCVYSPSQYAALCKVVAGKISAAGLSTRLFGPEDIGSVDRFISYTNALPDIHFAFLAAHGYAPNGITPDSPDARIWQTMFDAAAARRTELWMTETSGYGSTWADGFALAHAMYTCLRFGHVSGWCWWQAASADSAMPETQALLGGPEGLTESPKCSVVGNFARYVRPGAVRIGISSDDPAVLPLAFAELGRVTIVLINDSANDVTIHIHGMNAGAWHVHRSSATENCADLGSASLPISLPPSSVTTLQCDLATLGTTPK